MMNKRELIYSIAEQTGYTQSAVRKVLNTFIDTVFNEVKSENKVRIGGLGVFSPVLQSPALFVIRKQWNQFCLLREQP